MTGSGSLAPILLVLFLGVFVLGTVGLWVSGAALRIERATIQNAALASLAITLLAFMTSLLALRMSFLGAGASGLLSAAGALFVLQEIFETTWVRALLCMLFKWILVWLTALLGILVTQGGAALAALVLG